MARRREAPEPVSERGEPPRWLLQTLPALVEFHRRFGVSGSATAVPDGFTRWWRAQKDDWCSRNGCLRVGRTCREVSPSGKGCGARAGQAVQPLGADE
jgi:hypothetical protein